MARGTAAAAVIDEDEIPESLRGDGTPPEVANRMHKKVFRFKGRKRRAETFELVIDDHTFLCKGRMPGFVLLDLAVATAGGSTDDDEDDEDDDSEEGKERAEKRNKAAAGPAIAARDFLVNSIIEKDQGRFVAFLRSEDGPELEELIEIAGGLMEEYTERPTE